MLGLREQPTTGSYSRISKKWVGFVTAIWVQAIAGNNYTFANYSPALKAVMHYNQLQLNNLGVAKDVGKSIGLLAGLLADYLPTWSILMIGGLEGMLGYGIQYLVVSQRIGPLPYWQMCVALCLGGNSTTWMNTAVLVTCMRNFPRSRGTVTGMLKGYIGLSTAIFTQLCTALFTSEASSFLLLLTFLPAVVCLVSMCFLEEVAPSASDGEDAEEQSNFSLLNAISMALALYLLAFTVIEDILPLTPRLYKAYAQVLLLFLASPLVVPFRLFVQQFIRQSGMKLSGRLNIDDIREPLLGPRVPETEQLESFNGPALEGVRSGDETQSTTILTSVSDENEHFDNQSMKEGVLSQDTPQKFGGKKDASGSSQSLDLEDVQNERALVRVDDEEKNGRPKLGEDFSLAEAVLTIDFWLLFFTFMCGIGTGITAINNLGQIGEAQGYTDVSIFISLVSIWGFFGRVGAGALSEFYVRRAAIPRPVWMALSQVVMLVGYVSLATAAPGSLYFGSILVGICYGVHISITVPTASELFGLKHFGIIYNFLILNIPIGSLLFSGVIAGYLYDREADRVRPGGILTVGSEHLKLVQVMDSSEFSSLNIVADDDPVQKCFGAHCFRVVFLIMAGMCTIGFVLNVILILRIRPLYRSLYGPAGSIDSKKLKNNTD